MKVAVGISGGVDSAVTARLLQERGDEVIGVTMTLGRADEAKSLAEAKAAAKRLDIPLEVFDLAAAWDSHVLQYVRTTYLGGETPNPCVRCNETVKFGLLPRLAFERLGCDRFATGHYARLNQDGPTPRLFRGVDRTKDQSYFLYRVNPEILARTLFPLGPLTKTEVREKARTLGWEIAERNDSQDFCGGDAIALVGAADRKGPVETVDGKVIGTHRGYWHYTIGQRKGLGIGGGTPYFIVRLDAARNAVIVAFRESAIGYELKLRDPVGRIDLSLPVKVRSGGEPRLLKDGILGIAPGQSAVFYEGEEVVGGGIIV